MAALSGGANGRPATLRRLHAVGGFTNRSLRAQVNTLLSVPYSMQQMSYDLRRLRLKGLITRLP